MKLTDTIYLNIKILCYSHGYPTSAGCFIYSAFPVFVGMFMFFKVLGFVLASREWYYFKL